MMTTDHPPQDRTLSFASPLDNDCDEDPVMIAFHDLVHEQASLGSDSLVELHRMWLGPRGVFAALSAEIEHMGRQAPGLDDVQLLETPQRIEAAERAIAYALAKSNRRVATVNPLRGRSREALCCIAFDEYAGYTLVERYTAYEAIRESDSAFFIKLIATTRGVSERRIVFRGLLEHYDRLMPLEKCIFPLGYRAVQQAHLEREEAARGGWMFEDDVLTLLEKMTPLELLRQVMAPVDLSTDPSADASADPSP